MIRPNDIVPSIAAFAIAVLGARAADAGGQVHRVPEQFATIQEAADAASPGDAILVGPGIYREILALRDSLHVESDPPGAAVIVGEVHFHFIRGTVFTGFTVVSNYGGIHSFGGGNNRIIGNIVSGGDDPVGPGITCYDTSPLIEGNVIFRRQGIGIYCQGTGSPHIIGNTIVENGAGTYPRAGIFVSSQSAPVIERNIIAWGGGPAVICEAGASPVLTCNDFFANAGGDAPCGTDGGGNFSLDPKFCDVAQGDLSLRADSPCAAGSCGQIGAHGVSCSASAVEEMTWGAIKARLRR